MDEMFICTVHCITSTSKSQYDERTIMVLSREYGTVLPSLRIKMEDDNSVCRNNCAPVSFSKILMAGDFLIPVLCYVNEQYSNKTLQEKELQYVHTCRSVKNEYINIVSFIGRVSFGPSLLKKIHD